MKISHGNITYLISIKQVKHVLPIQCLRTLYYSLIHSHISYGIVTWGSASQSALRHSILLQKRAIRIINNASFNSHTEPLFRSSKIMKITDMYEYQSALFIFDFIHDKLPASFRTTFRFNRDVQDNSLNPSI